MALRAIYFDTETTGTSPTLDRIVEIAAFDPVNNKSFCRLVNPKVPISSEVSAIHGITDAMVASEASFDQVGKEFIQFCGEGAVLVAHNGDNFDIPFLAQEGSRNGVIFPSYPSLDTLKWARKYRPDLPRHSLQFLRSLYGIKTERAHRALDDVMVLYELFSIMLDDLTIEQALALLKSGSPSLLVPMTPFSFGHG